MEPGGGDEGTRDRLLEAGAACFAGRGFEAVTVRQLARAAGCNPAAVSYYFGGKDQLYRAVYRRRFERVRELRSRHLRGALVDSGAADRLDVALRALAEAFAGPFLADGTGRETMRLFARELVDPHLPPRMLLSEVIRPMQDLMVQALAWARPALRPDEARLFGHGLVGQLIHFLAMEELSSSWGERVMEQSLDELFERALACTRVAIDGVLRERAS